MSSRIAGLQLVLSTIECIGIALASAAALCRALSRSLDHAIRLGLLVGVLGLEVKELLIHHNLPCVHWEVGVVERPVELLPGYWLVCWVVVWREVLVREGVGRLDTLAWVENEHALEKVDCCAIVSSLYLIEACYLWKPT